MTHDPTAELAAGLAAIGMDPKDAAEYAANSTTASLVLGDARKAQDRYNRDNRFASICQRVVHDALERHPDMRNREGVDFALDVAAEMLERIFTEDAELHAQRAMADHYRKFAESVMALMPPRLITPKASK